MPKKQMNLKVDEADLTEWKRRASERGMDLSKWIREQCSTEAARKPRAVPVAKRGNSATGPFHGDAGNLSSGTAPTYLEKPDHDPTCQCGICDFKRKTLKER